jgi:hypothetical protein
MITGDVKLQMIRGQIRDHLGLNEDQLQFHFSKEGETTTLEVITKKSTHEQSFLFHRVRGLDDADALARMLSYTQSYKERENSYTIQWAKRGGNELHTSYFRGENIYKVLEKFNHDRDIASTVIYSIVLSPVA